MKRILMLLLMVFGCVTSGMAQDEWFEKELKKAQRGNAKSQFYVATYYEKGEGCTQDYDKALYWYVECVKNGDYNGDYHNMYMLESGGKRENLAAWAISNCFESWKNRKDLKNPATAFQMVDDAVKKSGSYILKKLLADWYYDGFGVTEDHARAFALYEELFKHQYEFGSYPYSGFRRMVLCYYEGSGTPVDYKKAMMCDRFKAGGSALSDNQLLNIYITGDRYDKALNDLLFEYFSLRVDSYIRTWIENAARGWGDNGIYMNGKFYGRDEKTYANNSSFNAYNCSPYAAYCYGNAYETGRNVPVDIKQAKLYYAFAIKRAESARYPNQYNEVKQLAQQALDRLNGNGIRPPQPSNLPNITFLSPSSSSSTSYNLKACIKSSSQISGVKVTLNGSMVINRTRGFDPVPNDGCAYTIDQTLTLKNGFRNEIIVSITNSKGTKTDTLYVSVGGSPIPPQSKEKRVALVIGNSNYQISPLKNPVNDATDIAAKLRNLGFQVTLKTDLTHYGFDNTLKNFENQAKGSEIALVFYAGHGMEADGVTYLIPTDAPIYDLAKLKYESVDANYMLEKIGGAKKKIVILDACRNLPGQRDPMHGGLGILSATNAFFAYSTSPGTTASDGLGRNSPYTSALLAALDYKNMTLPQLFQKVSQEVTIKSSQIPWTSSSLVDDVILNK